MFSPTLTLCLAIPLLAYGTLSVVALLRMWAIAPLAPRRRQDTWALCSVIVPACNEERTIEAALRSKLASTYPRLELIAVNDRSSDGTGNILDQLRREDARLHILHIKTLPSGWLGKVHALEQGLSVARGEWIVFSDADVHMSKTLLEQAVQAAEARGLDVLTLLPYFRPASFLVDAGLSAFFRWLAVFGRPWRIRNPKTRAGGGAGVFTLFRRTAYERSLGLSSIRMEVADDIAFGQMLKASGARCDVLMAGTDLDVEYYSSVGEMVRGFEKNIYGALGGFRPFRMVLMLTLLGYCEFGWLLVALCGHPTLQVFGHVAGALLSVATLLGAVFARRPPFSALIPVVGVGLFFFAVVRAFVLTHWRGGISWRGTFYDLATLREGHRLAPPWDG